MERHLSEQAGVELIAPAQVQQLAIPTEQKRYGQTAMICNVSSQAAQHVAYERFTDSGSL